MTYGQDDAAAMLEDLGEDVTIGAVTAKGLFRRADEIALEEQLGLGTIVKSTHIVVERGKFPTLAIGVAIQVSGAEWIARKPLDLRDPRFVLVELGAT